MKRICSRLSFVFVVVLQCFAFSVLPLVFCLQCFAFSVLPLVFCLQCFVLQCFVLQCFVLQCFAFSVLPLVFCLQCFVLQCFALLLGSALLLLHYHLLLQWRFSKFFIVDSVFQFQFPPPPLPTLLVCSSVSIELVSLPTLRFFPPPRIFLYL